MLSEGHTGHNRQMSVGRELVKGKRVTLEEKRHVRCQIIQENKPIGEIQDSR